MDNRAAFLAGSIADIQSTIRAVDVKVSAIIIILLLPLQNLSRVFGHLKHFYTITPNWLALSIVGLFLAAWLFAFVALIRAIAAVGNPLNHIRNNQGFTGSYFLGDLYNFHFIDAFIARRKVKAKRDPSHVQAALPENSSDVEAELVFEQMKLAYIRDIKFHRMKWGLILALIWLLAGIAIFLTSKFLMVLH